MACATECNATSRGYSHETESRAVTLPLLVAWQELALGSLASSMTLVDGDDQIHAYLSTHPAVSRYFSAGLQVIDSFLCPCTA